MTPRAKRASAYRLRLLVGFVLIILLLAGVWTWSLYGPLNDAVRTQQRGRLTDIARTGAVAVSLATEPLDQTLSSLAAGNDVRFTLVDSEGRVLADTQEPVASLENHGDRAEVRDAFAGGVGYAVRRSETQGVDRMYVAVRAETAEGAVVVLRASESLDDIAALSAQTRRAGLLLLVLALLLSAGSAWWLARSASRPVEDLAASALAMADGDLSTPVPDEAGPLLPLSSALTALREQLRKRLTDLDAERQTLLVALNGLSDGVMLLEGERVALTNQALARMFRPTARSGDTLGALGLPAPLEAAIDANRDADAPRVIDFGPDPFRRYYRVTVIPLGPEGSERCLVTIADATDLMRLDAVRSDFVANVSHELKTPTASILLLAQSADQAERDGDTEQALAFLTQIGAEAERLRRLVVDLLDLSRLESTPGTDEVSDVRRAVDLAVVGHRPSAQAKDLSLSADLSAVSGEDVAVRCDATDLAVALDNMLANAVTYTEDGGIVIAVTADLDEVRISVADTGIGIPEADVERVFERFYRVDRARSRTSGGTGLGLSLVRNVAERAGGTVAIKSAVGTGTTVTLTLPRAR